jgi:hypothetical protein
MFRDEDEAMFEHDWVTTKAKCTGRGTILNTKFGERVKATFVDEDGDPLTLWANPGQGSGLEDVIPGRFYEVEYNYMGSGRLAF